MQQAAEQQQEVAAVQGVKDAHARPEEGRGHCQKAGIPESPADRPNQRQQCALTVVGLAETVVVELSLCDALH